MFDGIFYCFSYDNILFLYIKVVWNSQLSCTCVNFFVKLNEQRPSLLGLCHSEKKSNFRENHVHDRFINEPGLINQTAAKLLLYSLFFPDRTITPSILVRAPLLLYSLFLSLYRKPRNPILNDFQHIENRSVV